MQINLIEPVTKDRSRVVLDSGESFVLYKGELRLLKIKEQGELPEEIYKQIFTVVLPKRAKLRAMNLLKTRPYTEYELTKKLREGGYPEAVIDIAISYVKDYGYVNDKQYALDYIKTYVSRRSKKELYQKLIQKGIGKETLDAAFNDTYGTYKDARTDLFDESEVIKKTLVKKCFTGKETYEEKQKLLAYFYRRGFDMDMVYKAMDYLT